MYLSISYHITYLHTYIRTCNNQNMKIRTYIYFIFILKQCHDLNSSIKISWNWNCQLLNCFRKFSWKLSRKKYLAKLLICVSRIFSQIVDLCVKNLKWELKGLHKKLFIAAMDISMIGNVKIKLVLIKHLTKHFQQFLLLSWSKCPFFF